MKKIEIKSSTGKILYSHSCYNNTIKITLEEAVNDGVSLEGANLRGADLRGADLRGADLREADLRRADLSNTILDREPEKGLLKRVAEAALKEGALVNNKWHSSCGTSHCIAGWACALSKNGPALEERLGPEMAGADSFRPRGP